MLTRKEHQSQATNSNQSWINEVEKALFDAYGDYLDKEDKKLYIHSEYYPEEFFLGVSFLDSKDENVVPISFKISLDLVDNKTPKDTPEIVSLDALSIVLEHFLDEEITDASYCNWTPSHVGSHEFFYEVSRDNIKLHIEANKYLD